MRLKVRGKTLFFDVEEGELAIDGSQVSDKPTLILLHGGPGVSGHTVRRDEQPRAFRVIRDFTRRAELATGQKAQRLLCRLYSRESQLVQHASYVSFSASGDERPI